MIITRSNMLVAETMKVVMVVSSALPPTVEPPEGTTTTTEGLEDIIEAMQEDIQEDIIALLQFQEECQGQ
jgi:hypothetical protein